MKLSNKYIATIAIGALALTSCSDMLDVTSPSKKDDATVMELMDRFTLAQIMGFIQLAQKTQAVNVLALLLDYKNARFADFDAMDEFTLE